MGRQLGRLYKGFILLLATVILLSGCSEQSGSSTVKKVKIGIMLSDVGLGDQSFSDMGFSGLVKARDEQGIVFDYREIAETKTYEAGFEQLVKDGSDLVVGLGFAVKESLEKVAKKYPNKQFLLVDEKSELPNVASMTFKEEEGSYLAGLIAGLTTKTDQIGFIGGVNSPLIQKFEAGFKQGIKEVNSDAVVTVKYAGDFGKADLGAQIASEMDEQQNIDTIYTAAGFTGVGALQEAQKRKIHAIGVDSDQFFIAEKSVITSMVKNVDTALEQVVSSFVKNHGKFPNKEMVFGLKENGVGLAPIRIITLEPDKQKIYDELQQKLASGAITIQTP